MALQRLETEDILKILNPKAYELGTDFIPHPAASGSETSSTTTPRRGSTEQPTQVDADPAIDFAEYQHRKATLMNGVSGNRNEIDGIDCPKCLNRGYIAVVDESLCIVQRECACMARRRGILRARRSGLGDLLKSCTFETWQTPDVWQAHAVRTARRYITDGFSVGAWFVAHGQPGCGKTHLCAAISGELLTLGLDVRYMLWREHSPRLKAAINDAEEYERLITPLKNADALFIDDFFKADRRTGAPMVTSADINLAFEILDARYRRRNTLTIISTELAIDDLLAIDEAVGSRIYERSKGYTLGIADKGANWRTRDRQKGA
jgi:DNA replication protein DnaC